MGTLDERRAKQPKDQRTASQDTLTRTGSNNIALNEEALHRIAGGNSRHVGGMNFAMCDGAVKLII
jgi:prepilin-type processing-associated H-X9-DG protein